MTRIVAINGSPKAKESVSGLLIEKMEELLAVKIDVAQAVRLIRPEKAPETVLETIAGMLTADVLLLVFPLYVDSLPAPLIRLLTLLEQAAKSARAPLPKVYAICNCGFYEAEHARLALRMARHFALRSGFPWGYGIGIGCGGLAYALSNNMGKGPAATLYTALCTLGQAIRDNNGSEREDVFVTPKIPRFLYKLGGNMGWRQMAKANGVRDQLSARPHSAGTGKQ